MGYFEFIELPDASINTGHYSLEHRYNEYHYTKGVLLIIECHAQSKKARF